MDHMEADFGAGSFDAGKEESRFEALLAGNSLLGKDLRRLFTIMKEEVHAHTSLEDLPDVSAQCV